MVAMVIAEKNRLAIAQNVVRPDIKAHIAWLEKRFKDIETDLSRKIEASELWRDKDRLIQSVKGVGPVTSRKLLATA